jgi:hypothetical protein
MKLAELQRTFAQAIQRQEPDAAASVIATGSERMDPHAQLEVYREQFWLRHVACLADDYPTLIALMGQAAFEELSARYLAAHPPVSFLLRDLGKDLAPFLAEQGNDTLLADVARVEWAFIDAFDAADAAPLDPSTIAEASEDAWPGARIALHPSIVLLDLAYPADELRALAREGEPITRAEPSPRKTVVYRRDLLLYLERVDDAAFAVLGALARGETLGAACSRAEGAEDRLGEWFTRWAGLGWISGVSFSSPAPA